MAVCFPEAGGRGLGVGMDLPWGGEQGFVRDPGGDDRVSDRVHRFLAQPTPGGAPWSHVFFSIQPRDRAVPRLSRYQTGWDDAVRAIPTGAARALHTTALDLGAARPKERGALCALVNGLVARHGFRWVNEDLGLWSLGGQPLPYPLPPYLTDAGLAASIDNVGECQRALDVPLLVEFPGFASGVSLPIGDWDAYDYFRVLAEECEAPVTLDVGHLLSWRWLSGHRGEALFGGLDRLPLAHCFELHLSGCEIRDGQFFDAHHGVLLDEQHILLERLLALCPSARAVTYEDPVIDGEGKLAAVCRPSLDRLAEQVQQWLGEESEDVEAPPPGACEIAAAPAVVGALDDALADLVYDAGARESRRESQAPLPSLDDAELESLATLVAGRLLERTHAGTGTLVQVFPEAFEDRDALALARRFLAAEGRDVLEGLSEGRGATLEEAFARFAIREGLADEATLLLRMARAVARAVALAGEPSFIVPSIFASVPGGLAAIVPTTPPTLVAVVEGRVTEGPITELLADLIRGQPIGDAAATHDVSPELADEAAKELARRGLRGAEQGGAILVG